MPVVVEADIAVAPRATLVIETPGEEFMFFAGAAIATPGRPLTVVVDEPDIVLPDFFDAGLAPIVSLRLLEALARAGVDNVESFPTLFELEDGRVIDLGHRVLNVVGRIDSIDVARSVYTEAFGAVFRFEQIALRSLPPDLRLWRPHEWSQILLADDDLGDALRGAALSGLKVTDVDQWVNEDY